MFYASRLSARSLFPTVTLALLLAGLSGCSDNDNFKLDLGSISIGAQFIDLKKAFDSGAINAAEYHALKADLLKMLSTAASSDTDFDDANAHRAGDLDKKDLDKKDPDEKDQEDDDKKDDAPGFPF